MHNLHSCHIATLFMGSLGDDRGGCRMRLATIHRMHQLIPLIIIVLFCLFYLLVSVYIGNNISTSFVHMEKSFHIPFSLLFSPIFQLCFFEVPDHSSIPLTMAYESVYSHTAGHFFFKSKCTTKYTAQSSTHCDLPSPLFFRDIPESGCNTAAVHLWMVL